MSGSIKQNRPAEKQTGRTALLIFVKVIIDILIRFYIPE